MAPYPMPDTAAKNYASVQVLRGIAVLLVVLFHAGLVVSEQFGAPGGHLLFRFGAAGVDIFFPISGFVMVISTRGLAGSADAWRIFLKRRIIRIVPLYWLATTLKLAILLAAPALTLHSGFDLWHAAASYLFVFARNPNGVAEPLLPIGWTLNYEMFFYAAFALVLFWRVPLVRVVSAMMLAVAVLGLLHPGSWSAPLTVLNPIVLEFVAGMALARLALAGQRVGQAAAILLGLAALACLAASDLLPAETVERARLLLWGLPGAALLLAAVSLESWISARRWHLPRLLGDASYSIYLSHGFILPPCGLVLGKTGLHGLGGAMIAFVVAILVSCAAGIALYRWVERPMTESLARRTRRQPIVAAAG